MNQSERLDLKRLMDHNEYEDNTEGIRKLKHSHLIEAEILKMENIKKRDADARKNTPLFFESICKKECSFLYNAYTDIFNRLLKDELDLGLMSQALVMLQKIEEGEIDQQEGAVMMGKMLHRVFVESALKRADSQRDKDKDIDIVKRIDGKDLSWKEYKKTMKK
jgi:hypothetical protein